MLFLWEFSNFQSPCMYRKWSGSDRWLLLGKGGLTWFTKTPPVPLQNGRWYSYDFLKSSFLTFRWYDFIISLHFKFTLKSSYLSEFLSDSLVFFFKFNRISQAFFCGLSRGPMIFTSLHFNLHSKLQKTSKIHISASFYPNHSLFFFKCNRKKLVFV